MPTISAYLPEFETLLPETVALLRDSVLVVHDAVIRVIVSGSRGLRGGYRPDSDIDLSLIIDSARLPEGEPARSDFLREVIDTTLRNWRSRVELDTAVVFAPDYGEGLKLFSLRAYDENLLTSLGRSSIALYKTQKGFDGYVPNEGLDFEKIYPLLTIWER